MINPKIHGYLDILTVVFFALAPSLFDLSSIGMKLSYTLAGVHLGMTLLTNFPMGMIKSIPIKVHGFVELVVGIALAAGPWIIDEIFSPTGKIMFSIAGCVILLVWLLSDYKERVEELI